VDAFCIITKDSLGVKSVANHSKPATQRCGYKSRIDTEKQLVEVLKSEWKQMWRERFDDKPLAEGVSVADYTSLRVDRGTIIHASRDYKALSFQEILNEQQIEQAERVIQPHYYEGGWSKFIKTKIVNTNRCSERKSVFVSNSKNNNQRQKKSRRGWLHIC
jgi:hypothetical protein